MNSRPSRTHRLRKRAWALAAALLSATECWAMDGQDASAPLTRTSETVSATSSTKNTSGGTSRPRIPPPRRYQASDFAAQAPPSRQVQAQNSTPERTATEPADRQPSFAPPRGTDGARNAVPLFAPTAANSPVASGAAQVSQSAAEEPAVAAVPTSGPAPSATSIAPAPSLSAAPVETPAVADAPSVGQSHEPVEVPAAANPPPAEQSPEQTVLGTAADAPAVSEHAAPATPSALSDSSAYGDTPAASHSSAQDVGPTASAKPPTPAELPAPADLPAPAGMASTAQSPLPADRLQSAQQAIDTLAKRPSVKPSEVSEPAPISADSSSQSTGRVAEKPATADRVAAASSPVVSARPEVLTASLFEAAKDVTRVPLSAAFAASAFVPAVSQAVTLPASNALLVAASPGKSESPVARASDSKAAKSQDRQVQRTHCSTCGGFHSTMDGPPPNGCLTCAGPNCVPGQKPCCPPANECNTILGAFCTNLYQEICCPDPCYQPHWEPAAYASFFADYARPRTITRIRYDNLEDMTRPDRNQFWINNVTPTQAFRQAGRTAALFARLQQVYLYQEAASERASFFVEYPYRQINQSWAPTQAGFGDINFGSKSLLFDREMLQITFQFRTFMPTGNFTNNLGTGQFALDPSLLTSLKLGPETYFQGQFGNWIPLGGPGVNRKLAGGIFYWFMSLNQVLCYFTPDSPLIATLEMDGWSFEDGGFTPSIIADPNHNARPHNPNRSVVAKPHPAIPDGGGVSYFNIGPGLRQSICNRIDFGGAITWATDSAAHWAQPWFRFELRILF